MNELSRDGAWKILTEFTKGDSLLKHALSVEAAMRFYAGRFGEDIERWGVTGLLHDFDYEAFPDYANGGHPYKGAQILRERGYPEDIVEAIMGHAQYTGVERKSTMAKALFAVDELTGLVTASVLVRPDRSLQALEASSVKKKMKDKAFARAVNRDEIVQGAQELGVDLTEHITNVITAMRGVSGALGLGGA